MDIEAKKLIGERVKCKGFYKKVLDGRLMRENPDKTVTYMVRDEPYTGAKCDCSGKLDFLKIFYEHEEDEFEGIVTAVKRNVIISHYLVAKKYGTPPHDGIEFSTVVNEKTDCLVVLYSNNKKHYVPFEDVTNWIIPIKTDTARIDKIK